MREYFNPAIGRWFVQLDDGSWEYRYRHLMAQHLGRSLSSEEHVHHINDDRTDDRLENLQILDVAEHTRLHNVGMRERIRATWDHKWSSAHPACVDCGSTEQRHIGHGRCYGCYWHWLYEQQVGRSAVKCQHVRFSSDEIAELVVLYEAGASSDELAEQFGCSAGTIQRRLRDAGVSLRRGRLPKIHCPKGHPYDDENTFLDGETRRCKACNREKARRYYHAKKAAA